jgi:hypothetical protein
MESSSAITATAKLWRAGTIAMHLSRRLLKAKYVKMHQQNRYNLQSQRKHNLIRKKSKVMNKHIGTLEMTKQANQRTTVAHEMTRYPIDRCQQTQKPNLHELEMNGVMSLIPDQIIDISQITKLKEKNTLNRTRELIYAEILVTKNIAEQSLLLGRRERTTIDKLESENRNLPRSMTYSLMMTT